MTRSEKVDGISCGSALSGDGGKKRGGGNPTSEEEDDGVVDSTVDTEILGGNRGHDGRFAAEEA